MMILRGAPAPGRPMRLLCLGAHADDIEIGCGGTVLSILRGSPGVDVLWVVLSGNEERAREAEQSARLFLKGAHRSTVLLERFRDGFFPSEFAGVKEYFESQIKPFEPDVIFTHCREDRHQDHRVVSDLTWNTFRNHFVLEYEVVKYDGDLGQPGVFVPLEADLCREKIGMIMDSFGSQRGRHWFTADTFESILRLRGVECRSATGMAEAFHLRKAVLALDGSHS